MINKSDSKWLSLATIPILGQATRPSACIRYCVCIPKQISVPNRAALVLNNLRHEKRFAHHPIHSAYPEIFQTSPHRHH
jgi:hypothetical protein